MIEFPLWIVALIGILPCAMSKKRNKNGTIFTIRAVSWSLSISWSSSGKCDYWMVRVPLFERARHLFWDVLFKERHAHHDEEIPAKVVDDQSPPRLVSVGKRKCTRC